MTRHLRALTVAIGLLVALSAGPPALAQKQGGILRQYIIDSPASMSIHEETTVVAERPMMAVMNNLILFDQHVAQNSLSTIVRNSLPTGRGTRMAQSWSSTCARASNGTTASPSPPPTSNALSTS